MRTRTLFASVNLIGDTITQTPALRRYRDSHPEEELHWLLQDGPARCLFEKFSATKACDVISFDADWSRVRSLGLAGYSKRFLMDVGTAFEIGATRHVHMAQAFGAIIGVDVPKDDILPTVPISADDFSELKIPSRCLVISPLSSSNQSVDGVAGNKNLPWRVWPKIVDRFLDAGRVENYVLLLHDLDPVPEVPLCVLRLPLALAVGYIAKACAQGGAYCGVDNGMTHIAAGLGVPTFCIYPQCLAEGWAGYSHFPHYRLAQTIPWKADIDQVWECWKQRL